MTKAPAKKNKLAPETAIISRSGVVSQISPESALPTNYLFSIINLAKFMIGLTGKPRTLINFRGLKVLGTLNLSFQE